MLRSLLICQLPRPPVHLSPEPSRWGGERLLQCGLHTASKLRAGMILAQVATPSQQMREAGLMRGRGELATGADVGESSNNRSAS